MAKHVYAAKMGSDNELAVMKYKIVYENSVYCCLVQPGSDEVKTIEKSRVLELDTPEGISALDSILSAQGWRDIYFDVNPIEAGPEYLGERRKTFRIQRLERDIVYETKEVERATANVNRSVLIIAAKNEEMNKLKKELDQLVQEIKHETQSS